MGRTIMSLPRKRESTIADSLDSRFRGNDGKPWPLGVVSGRGVSTK